MRGSAGGAAGAAARRRPEILPRMQLHGRLPDLKQGDYDEREACPIESRAPGNRPRDTACFVNREAPMNKVSHRRQAAVHCSIPCRVDKHERSSRQASAQMILATCNRRYRRRYSFATFPDSRLMIGILFTIRLNHPLAAARKAKASGDAFPTMPVRRQ